MPDSNHWFELFERCKQNGDEVRVFRSQLVELASEGISAHDLRELGIKIEDDSKLSNQDVVICLPLADGLMFSDNIVTVCAECGIRIQHRPLVPRAPRKLCYQCAEHEIEKKPRLNLTGGGPT